MKTRDYISRWGACALIGGSLWFAFLLLGLNPTAGALVGLALSIHGELAATKVE